MVVHKKDLVAADEKKAKAILSAINTTSGLSTEHAAEAEEQK